MKYRNYNPFELFAGRLAVVTAGSVEHHNGCTIGWGAMGPVWKRPDGKQDTITVYVHPARHTCSFMKEYDTFTVSFFPEDKKSILGYMGSHSGRNEDKEANAGLHAVKYDENTVIYEEAELTFVCRKTYQGQFDKEGLSQEIKDNYISRPQSYPLDENGDWQPHWMFFGDIIDVVEKGE